MDKVEALARRMCMLRGFEPDLLVYYEGNASMRYATPLGMVCRPPPPFPMWHTFASTAQDALSIIEESEMPQLVQATYYKDVVRVAMALASPDVGVGSLTGAIMSALKGMANPQMIRDEIVKQCKEVNRGDKPE